MAERELRRVLGSKLADRADLAHDVRRLLARPRRVGHERIHQRALTLASALAHHDAGFPERYLAGVLAASRDRVLEVGREVLRVDSGVLGWSLPESNGLPVANSSETAA